MKQVLLVRNRMPMEEPCKIKTIQIGLGMNECHYSMKIECDCGFNVSTEGMNLTHVCNRMMSLIKAGHPRIYKEAEQTIPFLTKKEVDNI